MLAVVTQMWANADSRPTGWRILRGTLGGSGPVENRAVCRYSSDGKLRITTPCSLTLAVCGLLVRMLSGFFWGRRRIPHRARVAAHYSDERATGGSHLLARHCTYRGGGACGALVAGT
jgi:hypothetical protein